MHGVIEVREVVVACPIFDLARVAIGSSFTIRPARIGLLQPFLILALELVLEDDAVNVSALLSKPLRFAQVRAIELDVVRQLTRPADARIERLLMGVLAITTMGLQEVMAALRQRHGTLAAVNGDEPRQALVPEMAEIAVTRLRRFVAWVAEIALGDHPKRPDRRKRPAVVAV